MTVTLIASTLVHPPTWHTYRPWKGCWAPPPFKFLQVSDADIRLGFVPNLCEACFGSDPRDFRPEEGTDGARTTPARAE